MTLKKDANPTIFEDLECEEKKDALLDHNYFIEAEKERKAACKKTEVIEMMDKKLRNARKRKRKVEEENVSLGNKIGMYTGADTGFSSGGGTNRARSARKIFCPPPELLRGGTGGGRGGTEFCILLRFCTIYIMSLQENIKKKIFVPP